MGEGVHELERLTARELQQLIEGGTSTAVVPFGSVEHHGGHLPLGADAILADAVGAEVARRLGAVLAPTVRVGCSDRHSHLPGTLTLGPETLTRLAIEHARALAWHGFTLIVLLSAHGGRPARPGRGRGRARRLTARGGDRRRPARRCRPESRDLFRGVADVGDAGPACLNLVELAHASPDLARELATATATRGQACIERFTASVVASICAPGQEPLIPALPLTWWPPQATHPGRITTAGSN